jgi:dynactin-6
MSNESSVVSEAASLHGTLSFGGGCVVHPSASLLALAGPLTLGECNVFDECAVLVNAPDLRLAADEDEGCCDGAATTAAVRAATSAAASEGGTGAASTVGHGNLFEVGCCVASGDIGDYNVFGARSVVEVRGLCAPPPLRGARARACR